MCGQTKRSFISCVVALIPECDKPWSFNTTFGRYFFVIKGLALLPEMSQNKEIFLFERVIFYKLSDEEPAPKWVCSSSSVF